MASKDDEPSHDETRTQNASAEAAGFVRGFARSLGRSIARVPIGSLPRRAIVSTRKIPVRQVARVSDRLATGFDLYSSAVESNTVAASRRQILNRVLSFGKTLLKNSLLGAAVFESYGYAVYKLAHPISQDELATRQQDHLEGDSITENDMNGDDEQGGDDEFGRASIRDHFGAGFLAGTVHGVASTAMERRPIRCLPAMTLHHGIAHSLLFGCYESIKRLMLNVMVDKDTQFFGRDYLVSFAMAGGLAGMVQHVASHYTEQVLNLSQDEVIDKGARLSRSQKLVAPTLRPLLLAFPASSIGFVAFEYGKRFTT